MKTFKFKDLAVTVNFDPNRLTVCKVISPSVCPGPTIVNCPGHTICHWTTICPAFTCGGCSILYCSHLPSPIPVDFTIFNTHTPVYQGIDELEEIELTDLRNNLAELQKYVEVKIQEAPNQLDMLEKKLHEALEEIRVQRANK